MQETLKIFRDLIIPSILLILVFVTQPYFPNLEFLELPFWRSMPFVVLGIALLLSWKFNRLFACYFLILAMFYIGILSSAIESPVNLENQKTGLVLIAFSLFIPINLIFFRILKVTKALSVKTLIPYSYFYISMPHHGEV